MKAESLGFASAVLASTCCAVPLGLALLGLGSLGIGSWIGAYHWALLLAAVALLGLAWGVFLREKRRARALAAELPRERTTRASLSAATAIVAAFLGLNVYGAVGSSPQPALREAVSNTEVSSAPLEIVTVPVRGMSCVSCEIPIERNLRQIQGVVEADASARRSEVVVKVLPGRVNLEAIAQAVREAGYEPELDRAKRS
jgi:copper chaperone CopZ